MGNKDWIDIEEQEPPIGFETRDMYFWTLDDKGEEEIFRWDQPYGGWYNEYGAPVDWAHVTYWQPIQRPSNTKKYRKNEQEQESDK